jgi:hypothetical protein
MARYVACIGTNRILMGDASTARRVIQELNVLKDDDDVCDVNWI